MEVLILIALICELIILLWLLLPKTRTFRYLQAKRKEAFTNESTN